MDNQTGAVLIRGFPSTTDEMPNSKRNGFITGLAVDSKQNILAVDKLSKVVKVFDPMGHYKYSFGENILKKPWDIFITSSGKIAVSDPGAGDIKIFSKSGKYLLNSEKGIHLSLPHGMAYHPWTKETIVADKGFSCVYVHDPDGEVRDMITKQDDQYGLGSPNYSCFDYAGNIYITDTQDQSLIAYDTDHNHIFTYGHPGIRDCKSDTELNNPGCVLVDRYGNILLADTGNCRIHLIDRNGHLKDYLLSWEDGLGEPQAMALAEDGTLIVSEANTGVIKIFSYTHLDIVNEINVRINGDQLEVESIESGPSLLSDDEENHEEQTHTFNPEETSVKNGDHLIVRSEETLKVQKQNYTKQAKSEENFNRTSATGKRENRVHSQLVDTFKLERLPTRDGRGATRHVQRSAPPIKGILKQSRKYQFDFFKPLEKNEARMLIKNSNVVRPLSDKTHSSQNNETQDFKPVSARSQSLKSAASRRSKARSAEKKQLTTAAETEGLITQSGIQNEIEPFLQNTIPGSNIRNEVSFNSNGVNDDQMTTSNEKETVHRDIPVVIIDNPITTSAEKAHMPKLNLKLGQGNKNLTTRHSSKGLYNHKVRNNNLVAENSEELLKLFKSSTSLGSAESNTSSRSHKSAVSIGKFSSISKVNEQSFNDSNI